MHPFKERNLWEYTTGKLIGDNEGVLVHKQDNIFTKGLKNNSQLIRPKWEEKSENF